MKWATLCAICFGGGIALGVYFSGDGDKIAARDARIKGLEALLAANTQKVVYSCVSLSAVPAGMGRLSNVPVGTSAICVRGVDEPKDSDAKAIAIFETDAGRRLTGVYTPGALPVVLKFAAR